MTDDEWVDAQLAWTDTLMRDPTWWTTWTPIDTAGIREAEHPPLPGMTQGLPAGRWHNPLAGRVDPKVIQAVKGAYAAGALRLQALPFQSGATMTIRDADGPRVVSRYLLTPAVSLRTARVEAAGWRFDTAHLHPAVRHKLGIVHDFSVWSLATASNPRWRHLTGRWVGWVLAYWRFGRMPLALDDGWEVCGADWPTAVLVRPAAGGRELPFAAAAVADDPLTVLAPGRVVNMM